MTLLQLEKIYIDHDYRSGALAYRRAATGQPGPVTMHSTTLSAWQRGYRNEQRCRHVVDGCDVVTSGMSMALLPPEPSELRSRPRATYLRYARDLMMATGMYQRVVDLLAESTTLSTTDLTKALAADGHVLSRAFGYLVRRRVELDQCICGDGQEVEEIDQLATIPPASLKLVTEMALIQDEYYDHFIDESNLASHLGLSKTGLRVQLQSAKVNGLVFLFRERGTHYGLTPKGWRVAMESGLLMSAEHIDDPISSPPFDAM